MLLARAFPLSALRPTTAVFAPASANPSANAPPNAPVAPITTATSLDRSNSSAGFIRRIVGFSLRESNAAQKYAWEVQSATNPLFKSSQIPYARQNEQFAAKAGRHH